MHMQFCLIDMTIYMWNLVEKGYTTTFKVVHNVEVDTRSNAWIIEDRELA